MVNTSLMWHNKSSSVFMLTEYESLETLCYTGFVLNYASNANLYALLDVETQKKKEDY